MIKVGILTVSDRSFSNHRPDLSGPALINFVDSLNWEVVAKRIVPDELDQISSTLIEWTDSGNINLILTTGGTGFSPRDITPEATLKVVQRLAPGLAEVMRFTSLQKTPHAMLTRSICGIRDLTIIINLPGNPKAAVENLQSIQSVLPHAIELLLGSAASESHHNFNK
jgi:molybdenum cofactor synthesis domain-containing protein